MRNTFVRVSAFTLAFLTLLCSFASAAPMPSQGYMTVRITAVCEDYNHVGDEWYLYSALDGNEIQDGDTLYMYAGSKFDLYTQMTEYDVSGSDVGYYDDQYSLSKTKLNKGFVIDQVVYVYEDKGVYKDYWCEWYVTYEFIPA